MSEYDALVVGAGPAGASAAYALARGGARVALLERERLPRYKPCGGGITGRARAASPLAARAAFATVAQTLYIAGDSQTVACELPATIGMTMRDRFDAYLVEQAVGAGVTLYEGLALQGLEAEVRGRWRASAGKTQLHARYMVGADGANGVTARLSGFGPSSESAAALEAEVAVPDAVCARYTTAALLDFAAVHGGYAWIFGKGDHLSVGVCTVFPRARRRLRAALDRFLATYPDLRGARILLQRGHRVPLAGGRPSRCNGTVLLAGDAAALADPLTGEGISYALLSGDRAGRAVLAALGGDPDSLAAYDRMLLREVDADLRYARLMGLLIYRYAPLALRLTVEHVGLQRLAAEAASGTLEYRSLVCRLVRQSPKLLRYAL